MRQSAAVGSVHGFSWRLDSARPSPAPESNLVSLADHNVVEEASDAGRNQPPPGLLTPMIAKDESI